MSKKKILFVGLLIILVLGLFFVAEFLAHKLVYKKVKPLGDKPLGEGYTFSTHDGIKVSKLPGDIKLMFNPFTLYSNFPGQHFERVNINSCGLRGKEPAKIKGKKRIIILGGSSVFGIGAENDSETFVCMLEKMGGSIEVLNAGVIGFLSKQELSYLVASLADYKPDIIIAYNGWNDLFDPWLWLQTRGVKKNKGELGCCSTIFFDLEKQLIDNYKSQTKVAFCIKQLCVTVLNKSVLGLKIFSAINNFQKNKKAKNGKELILDEKYLAEIIDEYSGNLLKMNTFCKGNGIEFFVFFQPSLGLKRNKTAQELSLFQKYNYKGVNAYPKQFPPLYRNFINKVSPVLDKNNVKNVDMNKQKIFINSAKTLFTDVVHTNRQGNMIIAEIIYNWLKNNDKI